MMAEIRSWVEWWSKKMKWENHSESKAKTQRNKRDRKSDDTSIKSNTWMIRFLER